MRKPVMVGVMIVLVGLAYGREAGAQPQFETFLKVPGIPGGSTDKDHKDWIDVLSLSQGLTPVEGKRLNFACEIAVAKVLDVAGPPLWAAAVTGQVFPELTIEVLKVTSGGTIKVYEIELTDTRITSMQTRVDAGPQPVEELVFAPASANLSFYKQLPDGTIGGVITRLISCAQ